MVRCTAQTIFLRALKLACSEVALLFNTIYIPDATKLQALLLFREVLAEVEHPLSASFPNVSLELGK